QPVSTRRHRCEVQGLERCQLRRRQRLEGSRDLVDDAAVTGKEIQQRAGAGATRRPPRLRCQARAWHRPCRSPNREATANVEIATDGVLLATAGKGVKAQMIRIELPHRRGAGVQYGYSAFVECLLSLQVAFHRGGHPLAESRLRALRRLDTSLRRRIED